MLAQLQMFSLEEGEGVRGGEGKDEVVEIGDVWRLLLYGRFIFGDWSQN